MDGSKLLLFKDDSRNEVFLVRRNDIPVWQVTGGGIELGETKKQAAIREAKEETGFDVKVVRELGAIHMKGFFGEEDKTGFIYEGRVVSGEFVPEYDGCQGGWFSIDALPPTTSDFSKRAISYYAGENIEKRDYTYSYNGLINNFGIMFRHPLFSFRFLFRSLRS